jgi:hypothetical protein
MSRAPSTAASYDGSGQWFKIREWGATGGCSSWTLSNTYTFNLPSSLPNGEYLLRIEQLAVHNPWPAGIPQFYISCAQIRVTGGGSGSPNPTVSIPGHVRQSDPGYTANIYNQVSAGPSNPTDRGLVLTADPLIVLLLHRSRTSPVERLSSFTPRTSSDWIWQQVRHIFTPIPKLNCFRFVLPAGQSRI